MSRVVFHQLPIDLPEKPLCFPGVHKRRGCKTVLQGLYAALVRIYKEASVSLGDPQMGRDWKLWVMTKSDILWVEGLFSLKAVGTQLVISLEEDPSLYGSSAGISHSSGLVKCCKSWSIKALCLVTRCWEGDKVRWPHLSHTPWQWDCTPFSLLCFCFSPLCFLSADYKHFQGKVLR